MLLDIIAWLIVGVIASVILVPILIIFLTITIGPVYAFIVALAQRK